MMLNRVVLPAPFGPMMENTRPGATARLTSWSACTTPNAIDRCSVASTVMRASPLARSCPPRCQRVRQRRHDAGTQEDHDRHHDQTEDHVLVIVQEGQRLRQHHEKRGADK